VGDGVFFIFDFHVSPVFVFGDYLVIASHILTSVQNVKRW
jgi:hypothetical protein